MVTVCVASLAGGSTITECRTKKKKESWWKKVKLTPTWKLSPVNLVKISAEAGLAIGLIMGADMLIKQDCSDLFENGFLNSLTRITAVGSGAALISGGVGLSVDALMRAFGYEPFLGGSKEKKDEDEKLNAEDDKLEAEEAK